jgi:phosphoglycerate kinase
MAFRSLHDLPLAGKRVLLRAGFDVPLENGAVADATRIRALVPTMRFILDAGASLVLLSHQGRPKGKPDPQFSQRSLVPVLSSLLGKDVAFCAECVGPEAEAAAQALEPGDVLLLENLRFDPREEKNDPAFARALAVLGDVYVNDAFTNCHRAHASMVGLPALLPSCMGLQLEEEIKHLSSVQHDPKRPLTLVIAGAKMETKVPIIERFLELGDDILLGGAIANTFLAARGFDIGASLHEPEQLEQAQEFMLESEKEGDARIHVPRDVVAASTTDDAAAFLDLPVENIAGDMRVLDIGAVTAERYAAIIEKSGMIVWNGPVGRYETEAFTRGSVRIAEAIARATAKGAISIVGGGDTLDFHTRTKMPLTAYTFVSTGGGAMLDFISGAPMPALEALERSKR